MLAVIALSLFGLVYGAVHHQHHHTTTTTTPSPRSLLPEKERIALLEKSLEELTRQVMLQQLFVEERIRSDGDSGLKQQRISRDGDDPYMANTYTLNSLCSIHDHTNYDRTVGMGEFIGVLNGVEFRTRHNDYKLRMPSHSSKDYHALDDIPFPDVPPSVLAKHTVAEQIEEMRNYFKAFKFQNYHFRDYRKYFKPVMCYLEGAWTTQSNTVDEPFQSDRHSIDAASWFELQEKIRYTSYTGGKHLLENLSYLPTTIINVNGTAEFAQWNYRILCHPIQQEVPLAAIAPVDDMAARLTHNRNLTSFTKTRAARFHLGADLRGSKYLPDEGYGKFEPKSHRNGLLDRIMKEIPGKDNYGAVLQDHSFGLSVLDITQRNSTPLNTAYYHRWFKYEDKGAMGVKEVHRGFADQNLFVAQTTQPKVAEVKLEDCHHSDPSNKHSPQVCEKNNVRYSYAIPMEIIYLTPLYKWNPYNLQYRDRHHDPNAAARKTGGGYRNGGMTMDTAYNGTNYKLFYHTPAEFFQGGEVNKDKADTTKGSVGVIDRHGNIRKMVASGTRIFLPTIPGVGKLRMRYPIMPVHYEGSAAGKEIAAIKHVMNHMGKYNHFFNEPPSTLASGSTSQVGPEGHFKTSFTHQDPPGPHNHDIYVSSADMQYLAAGQTVTVYTTEDNGHEHEVEISFNTNTQKYEIVKCDTLDHCWDGHTNVLDKQDN